jgi:hypothetical protein
MSLLKKLIVLQLISKYSNSGDCPVSVAQLRLANLPCWQQNTALSNTKKIDEGKSVQDWKSLQSQRCSNLRLISLISLYLTRKHIIEQT